MIGLKNIVLKSNNLKYKLLKEEDKATLKCLLKDREVTIPAGFYPSYNDDEFDKFFLELTMYNTGIGIFKDNSLIGYVHVNKFVNSNPKYKDKKCVEIGFVIGKDYWNNGFGSETLSTITDYLLSIFDVCFAFCFTENIASRKVIEKCGYHFFNEVTLPIEKLNTNKQCFCFVKEIYKSI